MSWWRKPKEAPVSVPFKQDQAAPEADERLAALLGEDAVAVVLQYVDTDDGRIPLIYVPDTRDAVKAQKWLSECTRSIIQSVRAREARDN